MISMEIQNTCIFVNTEHMLTNSCITLGIICVCVCVTNVFIPTVSMFIHFLARMLKLNEVKIVIMSFVHVNTST